MPKLKESNNEREIKLAKSLCNFERHLIEEYLLNSQSVLYRRDPLSVTRTRNLQPTIRNPQSFLVAGVDEAGRGALAGPVVASAVILSLSCNLSPQEWIGINDSKKLSPKRRKEVFSFLKKKCACYAIGIVPPKIIDKENILNATFLAMKKAITSLNLLPDLILIDGNHTLNISLPQIAIKHGDAKCISIAAASIVAKVSRDEIMEKEHKRYPEFNFLKNKGYGTREHFLSLEKYSPCALHRKSFLRSMG